MSVRRAVLTAVVLLGLAGPAWAADPGLYPGARIDAEATRKARDAAPSGMGPDMVATTSDAFEKVMAFYKPHGKEVRLPTGRGLPESGYERELPAEAKAGQTTGSGIRIKQVIFILDGAFDLMSSKNWVSIAHPFILDARMEGTRFIYEGVRDITAIVHTKK